MRLVSVRRALVPGLVLTALASSTAGEGQGLQFFNLTPCRAVDTRTGNGGIVPGSTERKLQIRGICGVPSTALTVTFNVTAVSPETGGFLTLWPTGQAFPAVSNLNFNTGEPAIGNGAVVPLGTGSQDLSVAYGAPPNFRVHVVLDVTGYFK
jgi:hypothetical protein